MLDLLLPRYVPGDSWVPNAGRHRYEVVEVVAVQPNPEFAYDLILVACQCLHYWRFLHHYGRWAT